MKAFCTCDYLRNVNLGSLDGANDPSLDQYFFDDNYWEEIIDAPIIVIGRKGTGKSAVYRWLKDEASRTGAIVSNLKFKEFPFQRFLALSDDSFAQPNQYQSMWRVHDSKKDFRIRNSRGGVIERQNSNCI